jgi:cysteine desulfuration protein SufE
VKSVTIEELEEEFDFLDERDRTQFIIELGDELDDMPDELKTEENRVQGCLSNVWMVARLEPADPPVLTFIADSDSVIVRGLVAIALSLCSGRTASEIVALEIETVFERLHLKRYVTRMRSNGFYSMIKTIKRLAEENAA